MSLRSFFDFVTGPKFSLTYHTYPRYIGFSAYYLKFKFFSKMGHHGNRSKRNKRRHKGKKQSRQLKNKCGAKIKERYAIVPQQDVTDPSVKYTQVSEIRDFLHYLFSEFGESFDIDTDEKIFYFLQTHFCFGNAVKLVRNCKKNMFSAFWIYRKTVCNAISEGVSFEDVNDSSEKEVKSCDSADLGASERMVVVKKTENVEIALSRDVNDIQSLKSPNRNSKAIEKPEDQKMTDISMLDSNASVESSKTKIFSGATDFVANDGFCR